jgi:hypothetical protein
VACCKGAGRGGWGAAARCWVGRGGLWRREGVYHGGGARGKGWVRGRRAGGRRRPGWDGFTLSTKSTSPTKTPGSYAGQTPARRGQTMVPSGTTVLDHQAAPPRASPAARRSKSPQHKCGSDQHLGHARCNAACPAQATRRPPKQQPSHAQRRGRRGRGVASPFQARARLVHDGGKKITRAVARGPTADAQEFAVTASAPAPRGTNGKPDLKAGVLRHFLTGERVGWGTRHLRYCELRAAFIISFGRRPVAAPNRKGEINLNQTEYHPAQSAKPPQGPVRRPRAGSWAPRRGTARPL